MKEYWILLGTMLGACALGAGIITAAFLLPAKVLCAGLALLVAGLVWKLLTYRAAIIQLQADMTLVLNEMTRPLPAQSIHCNLCKTHMTPNEYAHHFCERLTVRAQALNDAKGLGSPASAEMNHPTWGRR